MTIDDILDCDEPTDDQVARFRRARGRVLPTVKRPGVLPFDPMVIEPGCRAWLQAMPMVPFLPKWMLTFGELPGLVVEAIHVGNCVISFVGGRKGLPAEVWSLGKRAEAVDLFLKMVAANLPAHATSDAIEGLFFPFRLGGIPTGVGNNISVEVENRGQETRTFWCAIFGDAMWQPFDDPLERRFAETMVADVSSPPARKDSSPTLPSAAPPTAPPAAPPATSEPTPESEDGAWASANWEDP